MRVIAVGFVLLALAASSATAAVKPKPWAWTTAVAVTQVERSNPAPWPQTGTVDVARCVGKGKQVARRYLAFACAVTVKPQRLAEDPFNATLFVKVRAFGGGEPCVSPRSLAAVPKGCLNPRGRRTSADRVKAAALLQVPLGQKLGTGSYQGPTGCLGYGAGYFECWFGTNDPEDPAAGWATLVLGATPTVTVTRMTRP